MASVNKAIIVGNAARDAETRYGANGGAITNVTIATTQSWKDKNGGDKKEETEWHRVAFFGKLAEIAGEYIKKGSPVYVEGRLRTREWEDKDGVKRYTTEIVAEQMQLLGKRGESTQEEAPPPKAKPASKKPATVDDDSDQIPF